MTAYYNENDPFAAAWLRELIKGGHIAPGEVDDRSIEDVYPSDLAGFAQCHFFAGIGVWSYALRRAGWSDDRPIWTGSCPCQPFSAAGKGKGVADERHLWPAFFHLIEQCGPATIVGEQVARKDGLAWLDLVSADMEGMGYAFGAVPMAAAGFGAPHIRERLYWLADADSQRWDREHPLLGAEWRSIPEAAWGSKLGGLADASGTGLAERSVADKRRGLIRVEGKTSAARIVYGDRPGPVNGFWRDADWIGCTDGKWRPVEPGAQPLADGAANRVGRLRGYGNALNAPHAQAFIEAVIGCT